jgi:rhodanese-related sulfurtransferase
VQYQNIAQTWCVKSWQPQNASIWCNAFATASGSSGRGRFAHYNKRNIVTFSGKFSMSTIAAILDRAGQRDPSLPYAGAVTPQEAFELLQADPNVKLIDVRTNAERDWVGRVVLPETQHGAVQWSTYPGGVPNPQFVEQLNAVASKDQVLLFLCRSGVRSRHSAKLATENGYAKCYDILEGFEGDKDAAGHRKTVGGWCKAGLPWVGA